MMSDKYSSLEIYDGIVDELSTVGVVDTNFSEKCRYWIGVLMPLNVLDGIEELLFHKIFI